MNSNIIVELKDTMSNNRLNVTDDKFKSYLRQLLYYLVITGIERGIISIKYNTKDSAIATSTAVMTFLNY